MEVRYKREMNHNYLIINAVAGETERYECKMLAGNCIDGLLRFRMRHHDGKKEFYYEITSKQPLSRLLEKRRITAKEIRSIILAISSILGKAEEYLLKEEQLLLEPDFIYIEPDQFSVWLCMLPGYTGNCPEGITELLKYFLEKVDHQDREGVVLAYNLYHESLKENYGMPDLLKLLSDSSKQEGIVFSDTYRMEEKGVIVNEGRGTDCTRQYCDSGKTGGDMGGLVRKKDNQIQTEKPKEAENRGETRKQIQVQDKQGFGLMAFLKMFFYMAAAEAGLWFLMGKDGIYHYGVWVGVVSLVLPVGNELASVFKKYRERQEKHLEKDSGTGETNRIFQKGDTKKEREDWKLLIEAETDTESRQEKEADSMPGGRLYQALESDDGQETTLLADLSQAKGMAVLESLSRERESIEIPYVPFIIGKHRELADCYLYHKTVSRLHLRIDKKEEVYIVTDLNSTNGTTVEGYHLQANETVSIKTGDIIYIADAGFRFLEQI